MKGGFFKMRKQSYLRKKLIKLGTKMPKSDELAIKGKLINQGKKITFSTKGAGRKFAREIVEFGGYDVPTQLVKRKR